MTNTTWKHALVMLPGVGASLLPKLMCPLCWPAYAGIVSSLGLGFLVGSPYLLPVAAAFLAVSTGALTFRAHQRHGYAPFWTGSAGALLVLAGKFRFESVAATYAGITLLVAASIWNIWPRRVIQVIRPSRVGLKTQETHYRGEKREAQNRSV